MKGKFSKNIKVFFSETIRGMKLILGIHAKDISFYINYVFYSGRIRTVVAMVTGIQFYHDTLMYILYDSLYSPVYVAYKRILYSRALKRRLINNIHLL